MRELALFAGVGGSILAGKLLGWRTVCAVEFDPYCQAVLMQRQNEGCLDPFPIWDDVRTFDGRPWAGIVDVVTAGFPCQPFSAAGKRLGELDERNMWPDTIRILREVRPRFAFLENVPRLLVSGYFGTILGDLAEAGFDVQWGCVSAQELGAVYVRDRLWIACVGSGDTGSVRSKISQGSACVDRERCEQKRCNASKRKPTPNRSGSNAPNTRIQRLEATPTTSRPRTATASCDWWTTEPDVVRMVSGVPFRVDRIRGLGNVWVPRVAVEAWRRLTG